ncbi:GNAT family N-acetyltransferase [Cronobacter turicensis]
MEHFYVRQMTLADMPFFIDQFDQLVKGEHVNDVNEEERALFLNQISSAIKINESGGNSGHFFAMLINNEDDSPAGMMWLRPSLDLDGHNCAEIALVHVEKNMRGKGGGSVLVDIAVNTIKQQRIIVKCFPVSKTMNTMLKRRGFEVMATSPRGSEFLCLLPSHRSKPLLYCQ